MSRLLPEGLNDPSMYDVIHSSAESLEAGECSHCFKEISGKQRAYSYRRHKQELCWSCVRKKNAGELGDPKQDIESQSILDVYGEDSSLPF